MKKILSLITLSLILNNFAFSQEIGRYLDSDFALDTVALDVLYGNAPALSDPYAGESSTEKFNLLMNIYQPKDDTLKLRPILIAAHGGGFVEGEKEHDDMLAFCDTFARKGYVTATIQYRQGMNVNSEISGARAVYRGLQDSRAAIRFIREKAAEYKIDTNKVYFLGSSAGGFMGVHNLFMNKENERPVHSYKTTDTTYPYWDAGPDLGALDAAGNSYNHNAHPNGVVALWSALADTALIESNDSNSPVLLVHGTADDYVFFDVGHPFSIAALPETYGSKPINEKLSAIGYSSVETYFVPGEKHEFYGVTNGTWDEDGPNAYWNTVVTKVSDFLFEIHKPHADFNHSKDANKVTFTQNSSGACKYVWDFGDSSSSTEANPIHVYADEGSYQVVLKAFSEIDSWDTLSIVIEIDEIATGLDEKELNKPTSFTLKQNYPNPFNPVTLIDYSIATDTRVTLSLYNILGEKIVTLINAYQKAGNYSIHFNGANFPSGIYLYKLDYSNGSLIKKMTLLK